MVRHKCESETVAYKIQAEIIDLTQPANTLKEHTFGRKFAFIEFLLEKCTNFSYDTQTMVAYLEKQTFVTLDKNKGGKPKGP